jgi:hypothetical protein
MRICIIAPNDSYLALAGSRIRYGRVREHLAKRGVTLDTCVISDLRRRTKLEHDVYVISKIYDSRSPVIAQILSRAGKIVGIDMFDDYFSQSDDSRFVHHRDWLRGLRGTIDFVMCSTPRMKSIMADYMPDVPAHVMNDPFETFDATLLSKRIEGNIERALANRQINVGWFGVGDNPHFPVGLHDLSAFGEALSVWRNRGYDVHLSVLTNLRALKVGGLEMLRRLPVSPMLDEWSEEKERRLIAGSIFCFLPVSTQPFSIAKSLNRAITTLTGGSQVLSAGFPLYEPLNAFIYRDPDQLVRDIESRRPAMRRALMPRLRTLLTEWADPATEAEKLQVFLKELVARRRVRAADTSYAVRPICGILQGRRNSGECHKFVQAIGQISVASIFAVGSLNYDMAFTLSETPGVLDLEISQPVAELLTPAQRALLQRVDPPHGKRNQRLSAVMQDDVLALLAATPERLAGMVLPSVFYPRIMEQMRKVLASLLPEVSMHMSETDPIFSVAHPPKAAVPQSLVAA